MKIALVHTTLPNPARGKEGGVTYYVHRLGNRLVQAGHAVTIFSADPLPAGALYKVRRLPAPAWATGGLIGRTFLLPWFMNRIPTREFDVVHTHGDDTFFFSRRRVRSLHGSALGELRSATSWRRRLGQLVLYPVEILSALTARAAIAQSDTTRRDFPFISNRVNYAVDTDLYRPGPKSERPSILFVGTLGGRKRGALLVDHFTRVVRPALPEAELWMVAEAPVGRPGVVDLGRIADEERMAELFRSAWVFCMPSSYEGFGLPYAEALASGTAVVTTSNPGAEEILRGGRDGLIVPEPELGETLLRLLRQPDRRAGWEAAARRRAVDYSWDTTLGGYLEIYQQV